MTGDTSAEVVEPGIGRRDIIRRGAVVAGVAWTTPLILQTAAGAQAAGCSPCTCTTAYAVKWDTNLAGLCAQLAGPPDDPGPNGIDPSCGNVAGGPGSYTKGTAAIVAATLNITGCSVGANSGTVTFSLKCSGRFYGYGIKGGANCTVTATNECTSSVTLSIPSNISHLILYYCCC